MMESNIVAKLRMPLLCETVGADWYTGITAVSRRCAVPSDYPGLLDMLHPTSIGITA